MELYFTRHGKTQWNQEVRFQGREGDSPLLATSYTEIRLLGERLHAIPFEKIISSPQKRAKTTAEGLQAWLQNPCPIEYDEGLREIGMGKLEGELIVEARKQHATELDALRYQPDAYDPSSFGGETYQAMLARSTTAVTKAVLEAKTGPLLFVSHGATLTGCIQSLIGQPLKNVRQMGGLENNTLTLLRVNEARTVPYELLTWNDGSHLEK